MREIPIYQVDAFTDRPFAGNPAAVCLLDAPLPMATMQVIAAEMNLSETAFVDRSPAAAVGATLPYGLRWFTPRTEVNLCGHATLASAAVLLEVEGLATPTIAFATRSGMLFARRRSDGIQLDFPEDPPEPYTVPAPVLTALGIPRPVTAARSPRLGMVLVEVDSAATVAALRPDMRALAAASDPDESMGYIVTAPGDADSGCDFVSRFFSPVLGIDEDPVTGSSHTVLAPCWSARLRRSSFHARQLSARGGDLWVDRLPGGRVGITGRAVIVMVGRLRLPG